MSTGGDGVEVKANPASPEVREGTAETSDARHPFGWLPETAGTGWDGSRKQAMRKDQENCVTPGMATGRWGASPQAKVFGPSDSVEFRIWSGVMISPV